MHFGKFRATPSKGHIMIVQGSTTRQQPPPRARGQQDITAGVRAGDLGTVMLDSLGRILSCGEPVEKLFGLRSFELMGRWISDFIAGLLHEGRSPSYDARYLAHLCRTDGWHEFRARNEAGTAFMVELYLSRIVTCSQEIFLLYVRRSGEAS